jgi:hypothetical protein
MNSEIETDEWKLGCFMSWQQKYRTKNCSYCNGSGEIGGGFGWIGDKQVCPKCNGTRIETLKPKTQPPPIPPLLEEHMRRAWFDYVHKVKKEDSEQGAQTVLKTAPPQG